MYSPDSKFIDLFTFSSITPVSSEDVIIDIKPELPKITDFGEREREKEKERLGREQFNSLFRMHDDLTMVDFVSKKTPEEIKLLNDEFKLKLADFKSKYGSNPIYKSPIDKFENEILKGRERLQTLELFNEPNNMQTPIETKTYDSLRVLTDLILINKNSSSSSYVFKGKYSGNPCFIKTFFTGEDNLLYEQKIYRYIQTRNERIKPYYEDYFVKVYDVYKTKSRYFKQYLNDVNAKRISGSVLTHWFTSGDLESKLNSNEIIYFMITEDIQGFEYKDFYIKNYKNEKLITGTLFDMVYGIYLMNDKLKLMHNDNHFSNVLIKVGLPSTDTTYQIGNIEYTRKKNYRLCFFDFDLSYLEGEDNPYLGPGWFGQNKSSAKDIWTILNSLVNYMTFDTYSVDYVPSRYFLNQIFDKDVFPLLVDTDQYESLNYIGNIVDVILMFSKKHSEFFSKNYMEIRTHGKFWNGYCINNDQTYCEIPDEPFLYALEVLRRLVKDERINKVLGFVDVDPFYRKYVKYKGKYLAIKKTLSLNI
jgi:hypothetical protein